MVRKGGRIGPVVPENAGRWPATIRINRPSHAEGRGKERARAKRRRVANLDSRLGFDSTAAHLESPAESLWSDCNEWPNLRPAMSLAIVGDVQDIRFACGRFTRIMGQAILVLRFDPGLDTLDFGAALVGRVTA